MGCGFYDLGVTTDFKRLPCCSGTAFDVWGQAYDIHSHAPLFYMVERGHEGRHRQERVISHHMLRRYTSDAYVR